MAHLWTGTKVHADKDCDKALKRFLDTLSKYKETTGHDHLLVFLPRSGDEVVVIAQNGAVSLWSNNDGAHKEILKIFNEAFKEVSKKNEAAKVAVLANPDLTKPEG